MSLGNFEKYVDDHNDDNDNDDNNNKKLILWGYEF